MDSTLTLADKYVTHRLRVQVAPTEAAERAAVAYLERVTDARGNPDYWVILDADTPSDGLLDDFIHPQCEHGLSLTLCAGPGHYPHDI